MLVDRSKLPASSRHDKTSNLLLSQPFLSFLNKILVVESSVINIEAVSYTHLTLPTTPYV